MSNIFNLENIDDFTEKINIDELYEKKHQHDLQQLELFNKILNRIHVRIKTTSKQKKNEPFCWYIVPEIIIGVPRYDQGACIAYILDKLKENGFNVRYIHPNTLFISWSHWVPSYIRNEIKKKTGIVIDEYGNKVENTEEDENNDNYSNSNKKELTTTKQKKQNDSQKFTPINSYKPSGNLIYNEELLNKLEDKFL